MIGNIRSNTTDLKWCLRQGTMILMADGTEKPVEEIQSGDMIKSYDLYNDCLIDVKCYGSFVTGTEKSWQRMVFENGKYLDIFGKHNLFTPAEGGRIKVSTNWKYGDLGFTYNEDHIEVPKYAQTVEVSSIESENRYRISCETSLYFANGILTGSAPEEMYYFHQSETLQGASDTEVALLKEIECLHDAYINREKNNIPFLAESASIFAKRNEIVAQRMAAKEELSSLDFKTIKRQQGQISDEEWVVICEKCEKLRKIVNDTGLQAWYLNQELDELREKHGIKQMEYDEFWRSAYSKLMTAYYSKQGKTLDCSELKTIKHIECNLAQCTI